GYQPIILPGESISKYRRLAESAPAPGETSQPTASQPASFNPEVANAEPVNTETAGFSAGRSHQAVPFATPEQALPEPKASTLASREETPLAYEFGEPPAPASSFGGTLQEEEEQEEEGVGTGDEEESLPGWDPRAAYEAPAAEPPSVEAFGHQFEGEFRNESATTETTETIQTESWREHAEESARRTGQIPPQVEEPSPRPSHFRQEEDTALTGPAVSPESPMLAAPFEHAVEEEEIDEDEDDERVDLSAMSEHFDDLEFEELEEETFEAGQHGNGAELGETLTEAVEDADIDREVLEGSFEEEDDQPEAWDEQAGQRAELRERPATAPFQQRTERSDRPERGGFDRRSRGRRGPGGPQQRRGMRSRAVQRPQVMISDVLKEGQEILVQIAKEPIGKKGARITSHIALPGRFLVYMPTVNHIGVSRKIASDEERQRLKRIVVGERENGHGGFIVRTAAENVREDELLADIRFLKHLWDEIKQRAESSRPPALIYHDLNLVERTLRDLVTEEFSHIWVDTEQEYERVLRFVNRFQPSLVRRVRLYTKETPLYEQFGIQEEINKALKSKVWLKSGGYIVINQTEALVAIDVNTGKYVGKTQRLEDTIVKTNIDAIKEIVRQVRLRDLGGIIVVDFIDMDERKNRQKVMQALEEALTHDRAPSKVLQFNDFGLVAITRKRVKHSLERVLGNPCPYCTGTGLVKSVNTVCNEIYTELKKLRRQFEKDRDILLRVNPEVAKALKASNARWLNEMEELAGRPIIVKPDPLLHQEQFDM
ncbi:MAG: Rne/Rng family ribonuclease, partial [Candidatus Korobacteraceae bacterium]